MSLEENELLTRRKFAELKFNHQVEKACRKGKLIEIVQNYDGGSIKNIVDPAFINYNYDLTNNTANRPLLIYFNDIRNNDLNDLTQSYEFQGKDEISSVIDKSTVSAIFNRLLEIDPTTNKEYVQWLLIMYTRVLKDREPKSNLESPENKLGGFAYLFFENLVKAFEAIQIFHKIKKGRLLDTKQKDIYLYRSIDDFTHTILSIDLTLGEEVDYNVLSQTELEQIHLQNTTIEYGDDDWIIVHTKNKVANNVFGCQTTWCTAGTKYGDMFNSYDKQGKLFVLIKNRTGSGAHIRSNPLNRLQFHFESDQFMDALDKSIDMSNFFIANDRVKNFFKPYIIERLIKKSDDINKIINILTKFNMVAELIPILKSMKIKKLDLTEKINNKTAIKLSDLGEISSLEDLILRRCNLTAVPESIRKLTNLKYLRLSDNNLTSLPEWINELKSLELLSVMRNKFESPFNVSGLTNLLDLEFAFNPKLQELPTGLDSLKNLTSLNCSFCDIRTINPDILKCEVLVQFNAVNNKNLKDIPFELINMEYMLFVGLDETGVPVNRKNYLNDNKKNIRTTLV